MTQRSERETPYSQETAPTGTVSTLPNKLLSSPSPSSDVAPSRNPVIRAPQSVKEPDRPVPSRGSPQRPGEATGVQARAAGGSNERLGAQEAAQQIERGEIRTAEGIRNALRDINSGGGHLDIWVSGEGFDFTNMTVTYGQLNGKLFYADLPTKKKKTYQPVPSRAVNSVQVAPQQEENAAATAPFQQQKMRKLSVLREEGKKADAGQTETHLSQISGIHQRSNQIATSVVWENPNGQVNTAIRSKGAVVAEEPEVMHAVNEKEGFDIFGLQDDISLTRTRKAATQLQEIGVAAETVLAVLKPTELPIAGEMVSVEEYKERAMQKIRQDDAQVGDISPVTHRPRVTAAEIPEVEKDMQGKEWVITVFGAPVNESIADLMAIARNGELHTAMEHAFLYANTAARAKVFSQEQPSEDTPLEAGQKGIVEFMLEYLPAQIAENTARAHNNGLLHGSLHAGNISLVGSWKDLDTVRGERLGLEDAAITDADIAKEISGLLLGANGFKAPQAIVEQIVPDQQGKFTETILTKYFEARGLSIDQRTINFLKELYTKGEYAIDAVELFTYTVGIHTDLRQRVLDGTDVSLKKVSEASRSILQDEIAKRIYAAYEEQHPDAGDSVKQLIQQLSSSFAQGTLEHASDELWQIELHEPMIEPFIDQVENTSGVPTVERLGSLTELEDRVFDSLTGLEPA